MRIKKFIASSIKEATEQMKQELGPEAIILHTRKLPKHGLIKSLSREQVEITAATDDHAELNDSFAPAIPETRGRRSNGVSTIERAGVYSRKNAQQSSPSTLSRAMDSAMEEESAIEGLKKMTKSFEQQLPSAQQSALPSSREISDIVQLKADVDDMKSLLQHIAQQLQYKHFGELPDALKEAYINLLQQDVEEKYALALANAVMKKLQPEQKNSRAAVEQILTQFIASSIPTEHSEKRQKKNKVVVLVGPTGVGKTTTIAKLAAIEKLVNGKNVALLSCDTYRIGAIEQLKTFAVIADIPMQVVYKAVDLPAALKKFQRHDTVFIDTVGRSQKAKKELQDLKKIVHVSKADEVHLVISSQTNTATLINIVENFSVVSPTHLIFSKLDEAAIFGPLFNIVQKTELPVSYFTTGQAVPDDICVSDGIKFAKMLYQGMYANA